MNNNRDDIKKSIEKLYDEHRLLDDKDVNYEKKRQALKRFISDLEYHVDNPDDKKHVENTLKKIPDLIKMFELKHQGITDTINKIAMILSNMGI